MTSRVGHLAAFLAYFCVMFLLASAFSAWMILIWWAGHYGQWWSIAAIAFGVAVISAFLLSTKDPAKVKR